MGMNFAKSAARYDEAFFDGWYAEGYLDDGMTTGDSMTGGGDHAMTSPMPSNRPTTHQPDVRTDGLDPAAVGGPAPYNSGQGPYGAPVASDPLVDDDIRPGHPVPYIKGPDEDQTVLH